MSMLSTRGAAAVSESMAILRGLAPDGGLYVPEDFPHFSMEEIAALGALDYQARALAQQRAGAPLRPRGLPGLQSPPGRPPTCCWRCCCSRRRSGSAPRSRERC